MTLTGFCSWAGRFESYLVQNPEDRFSLDWAHIAVYKRDSVLSFEAKVVVAACDRICTELTPWKVKTVLVSNQCHFDVIKNDTL